MTVTPALRTAESVREMAGLYARIAVSPRINVEVVCPAAHPARVCCEKTRTPAIGFPSRTRPLPHAHTAHLAPRSGTREFRTLRRSAVRGPDPPFLPSRQKLPVRVIACPTLFSLLVAGRQSGGMGSEQGWPLFGLGESSAAGSVGNGSVVVLLPRGPNIEINGP